MAAVVPLFAIGAFALQRLATPLDMLALGERQAQHLGLDVTRTRRRLVAFSALLVGAAVAFAGSISFVGLVVPHVARLLVGPGHRWLLPLSGLLGALLIVVADTAARTLDPPAEIPLGLFSARWARRSSSGWCCSSAASPMSALLKLHEVVVRRQQREILHGISLAFEPGTVTALVGPNGAGKSTLLAVAAGDLRADAGEVSLLGKPLASYKAGPLARARVMPQEHGVRFAFSVEEVVAMGRLPHPPDPVTDDAWVEAAIDAAELQALRLREVQQLSGGESARPRSRACWRRIRRCCCSMSRPPRWTCVTRSAHCVACVPAPRPVRA